jgi:hypothetical protein
MTTIEGTITISNNRRIGLILFGAGIISFIAVMFSTLLIMNAVYGIKPGESKYFDYIDEDTGKPLDPYVNYIANGCLKEPWFEGDENIFIDTRGLEGSDWNIHPTTCHYMATEIEGYFIDEVKMHPDGNMEITLTKQQ